MSEAITRELCKRLGRTPTQKELRAAGVGKRASERIIRQLGLPLRKPGQRADMYDDDHPDWPLRLPPTEG